MDVYDKEVIEIAELLVEKWRAYQIDSDNEDPDATAEALEIAVDRRNKNLGVKTTIREKAEAIYPKPTPSITVGTQVRLTGVVKGPTHKPTGAVGVGIDGCPGGFSNTVLVLPSLLEVIRQPFKRGEVVQYIADAEGKADGEDYVVVKDEESDSYDLLIVGTHHGDEVFCADPSLFERRP